MDSAPHSHGPAEPVGDLTLAEAAEQYAVSARTLALHIRCGQLPAYKTGGATGRQWRVTRDALDGAGYPPRTAPTVTGPEHPLVVQLRRELAAAHRAATAERRRAEDADRRLGHVMLECGRLRAALAAATGGKDRPAQVDLNADEARRLLDAVEQA